MKDKKRLLVLLVGVLLLAALVWWWLPPRVAAVAVQKQNLQQTIVFLGKIAATKQINLAAPELTQVKSIAVSEGQVVAPGQELLRLDDAEARAKWQQAQATLKQQRLQLQQLASSDLAQERQNLAIAQSSYATAVREVDKSKTLVAQGFYSAAKLAEAKEELTKAGADLATVKIRLQNLSSQGSDNKIALAKLEQAEAENQQAALRLAKFTLTAPERSLVSKINTAEGSSVSAGETLIQLVSGSSSQVEAVVDEKYLPYLQVGQTARVQADAFKGQSFNARLTSVAPVIDPLRGTVEVKLTLIEPPSFLRPDMTVTVDLLAVNKADALVVPKEYVNDLESAAWVALVKGGVVVKQPIEFGILTAGQVEISAGLRPGDLVVAAPAVTVGQRVRAVVAN